MNLKVSLVVDDDLNTPTAKVSIAGDADVEDEVFKILCDCGRLKVEQVEKEALGMSKPPETFYFGGRKVKRGSKLGLMCPDVNIFTGEPIITDEDHRRHQEQILEKAEDYERKKENRRALGMEDFEIKPHKYQFDGKTLKISKNEDGKIVIKEDYYYVGVEIDAEKLKDWLEEALNPAPPRYEVKKFDGVFYRGYKVVDNLSDSYLIATFNEDKLDAKKEAIALCERLN